MRFPAPSRSRFCLLFQLPTNGLWPKICRWMYRLWTAMVKQSERIKSEIDLTLLGKRLNMGCAVNAPFFSLPESNPKFDQNFKNREKKPHAGQTLTWGESNMRMCSERGRRQEGHPLPEPAFYISNDNQPSLRRSALQQTSNRRLLP